MPIRDHAGAAVVTELTANITGSDLSIAISDSTGWPTGGANGPFFVDINPDGANEEKILVASRTGNTLTVAVVGDRGVDGTLAAAHNSGESIRPTWTATEADEINDHQFLVTQDDHTQYMHQDGSRHDLTARHAAGSVVPTAVPGTIQPDAVATEGASGSLARADHTHAIVAGVASTLTGLSTEGVSTSFARQDHLHALGNGIVDNAQLATDAVQSANIAAGAINDAGQFADPVKPLVLLDEQTVAGAAVQTITFSSIPATFDHLRVIVQAKADVATDQVRDVSLRMNNDTANNYHRQDVADSGAPSQVLSGSTIKVGEIDGSIAAGLISEFDIPGYALTFDVRRVRGQAMSTQSANIVDTSFIGSWNNTAVAINRLDIFTGNAATKFAIGSKFWLYAI